MKKKARPKIETEKKKSAMKRWESTGLRSPRKENLKEEKLKNRTPETLLTYASYILKN